MSQVVAIAQAVNAITPFHAAPFDSGGNIECVVVRFGAHAFLFGTADTMWAGDVFAGAEAEFYGDPLDRVETLCDSTETDPIKIAAAIGRVIVAYQDYADWKPLADKLGPAACTAFMYMGTDKGSGTVHLYKHRDTRQYLNIDAAGNCYKVGSAADGYRYITIPEEDAIARVNS